MGKGKGLDYDELFPGRFLKAGLFKGRDVTLTISRVRTESLPSDKGGEKVRGIIGFVERPMELVLNRTNGECLKAMFGRDTGDWIGKRVTFWPAPYHDNTTGENTVAIRVRGSPDLANAITAEVRLPRKKPVSVTLQATGKPAAKTQQPTTPPPPAEEPPPPADDDAPF